MTANAIEIRDLCKAYPDFQLNHLNLTLPGGCILGLIGENGAGKSTVIKLILDIIGRDSGSITVLGRDNRKEAITVKEEIGVVLDEVGFPDCLSAKQIGKILKNTYKNWDNKIYVSYLEQFSIPQSKDFKDFSKGMKMKLGIAAALSHHPKLLILDEATSGLDPVVREEILDVFNEFTRDETHAVLISSHIVSDLEKICDYIAFLHKGSLLLYEEKDQLLAEYGILQCTPDQLKKLNSAAIKGTKVTPYGVRAIVRRDALPCGMEVTPITIEELFIFMVKEDA